LTSTASKPTATNTQTIARNSMWYGAETGFLFITTLFTSIAMARVIGPQKLGYFNYIMWLANMSGLIGSLGVPATTSKYMAEYLGRGEHGIARAVFSSTMRLQAAMAGVITAGALGLVYASCDPHRRIISAIQVASMLPAMLTFVPAQANAARENFRANALASLVGNVIYTVTVALSLALGWGLLGIAIGILVYRSVELLARLIPVLYWVSLLPKGTLPADVKRRMSRFSGNNVVLLLVNIVVWDRSDVVLLKMLSKDISQITFFTVAFNLVEKALILSQTFGAGVCATINAQFGRDRSRLNEIVSSSARYLLLFSTPILLGLAAISSPAIRLAYGREYIPAIPVLAIAAVMAIAKPLLGPAQQMLQANEQQKFLIAWNVICGVINIGVDWMLIPHHGALGAALGNGAAQLLGVLGPWVVVSYRFAIHLDYSRMIKTVTAAFLMMTAIAALQQVGDHLVALGLGIPLGALLFGVALRLMRVLSEEDIARLLQFRNSVPVKLRGYYVGWLTMISGYAIPVDNGV
jgi:O-antigen/teichoic acid export membrane protein